MSEPWRCPKCGEGVLVAKRNGLDCNFCGFFVPYEEIEEIKEELENEH